MGLRINTNVVSTMAQHKLMASSKKVAGSLEKLSSGLRINKGSDDVVGLLKSESLRSNLRGIDVALTNISNAQNMLGVAEGTLAEVTELGQKIREKAVAAADATISSSDRTNLTTAVNDLLNEFSRLVNGAAFDGTKLLDGTFTAKTFQVGPDSGQTISLTISDTRSTSIGKVAIFTASAHSVGGTNFSQYSAMTLTSSGGTLTVDGTTIAASAFTSDGISSAVAAESAVAYTNAINSYSDQTGVTAKVVSSVLTLTYLDTAGDIETNDTIILNGVTITNVAYSGSDAGMGSFASYLNGMSTSTGVSASVDASSNALILTAEDGRNISVFAVSGNTNHIGIVGISNLSTATNSYGTVSRGTFKLTKAEGFDLGGASYINGGTATASVTLNSATTLNNISLTSSANASAAIDILGNVITQLQNRRSEVGSKSIRMDAAESELRVRKENIMSAESKIRDVDVAEETAKMTSAQILQQAGAAVLAQANSMPQIALQLLQR